MVEKAVNRADLDEFYLTGSMGKSNLFEIWEDGGSRGDSVTPSTYSREYRAWMLKKLVAQLEWSGGGLLSLGCGNGAVEALVAREGFRVLAVDAMESAVALARRKGLDAICADIWRWEPEEPWSVIYLDGVLGHLYDAESGLVGILDRLRSWLARSSAAGSTTAVLVASNDAPNNGSHAQKAPGVNGFHWLSADYMRGQALEAGFDTAAAEEFRYKRPLSGERVRAIVTGYVRAPGSRP